MERCCKNCEWLGEDKEHYICYRDLMAGILMGGYRKEELDIEKTYCPQYKRKQVPHD
jgi:hypothetical protein